MAARCGAAALTSLGHGDMSSTIAVSYNSSIPLESLREERHSGNSYRYCSFDRNRQRSFDGYAKESIAHASKSNYQRLKQSRTRFAVGGSARAVGGRKGYGVALSSAATAQERFRRRQRLIERRIQICDWSVCVALAGLALAMIDIEICVSDYANISQVRFVSQFLRICVIMLTILLDVLVVVHRVIEVKILVVDTGHKSTSLSRFTCLKLALELLVCTCCPLPCSQTLSWSNLSSRYGDNDNVATTTAATVYPATINASTIASLSEMAAAITYPHDTHVVHVPINVAFTIPMFLRLYLVCRMLVLHSATHRDPSTRAIASFNQVIVDLPFVLKSFLCKKPLSILAWGTLAFWAVMTWIMTQCERFGTENSFSSAYYLLDYVWFEIVTFFAIGFGDIEMVTYCGRSVAIITGIVGTIVTSLMTVLISQRLLLSLAERRVNQVVAESQLSKLHKHEAARVLQWTWRVVRMRKRFEYRLYYSRRTTSKAAFFQLRMAQRNLLAAIGDFRRCRWQLRVQRDEGEDVITIQRAFSETEDHLRSIRKRQQLLGVHLHRLAYMLDDLSGTFTRHYPNCPVFNSSVSLPMLVCGAGSNVMASQRQQNPVNVAGELITTD